MSSLRFETQAPVVPPHPNRTDIACFVGYVGRRETELPAELDRWLRERGWHLAEHGRTPYDELLDVPVPVDTWDLFDHLFAWDERDLNGQGQLGTAYLGAAVRSFFAQGGRKCYVVRVGDPWPIVDLDRSAPLAEAVREAKIAERLARLIPGYTPTDPLARVTSSSFDQASWRGVGHLFGLPDVSLVCLPDLPDVVAGEPEEDDPPDPASRDEQWVECSAPSELLPDSLGRRYRAPRCDDFGYRRWAMGAGMVGQFLHDARREMHLVAAIPLPHETLELAGRVLSYFCRGTVGFSAEPFAGPLAKHPASTDGATAESWWKGLSSAFVQLAYPWVTTRGSAAMPEGLEPPDGALAGVLARNALTQGTFRSAATLHVGDVSSVYPVLSHDKTMTPVAHIRPEDGGGARTLLERVCLFGPTPNGLRLLSDVTTSLNESYRPGPVSRLVSSILRAARRLGEENVFENNDQDLWDQVRTSMEGLLTDFHEQGALAGQTPAEAFQVRCDRSTMTENDIDGGRLVAELVFQPAAVVERITVVFALDEAGQVSLVTTKAVEQEVA